MYATILATKISHIARLVKVKVKIHDEVLQFGLFAGGKWISISYSWRNWAKMHPAQIVHDIFRKKFYRHDKTKSIICINAS